MSNNGNSPEDKVVPFENGTERDLNAFRKGFKEWAEQICKNKFLWVDPEEYFVSWKLKYEPLGIPANVYLDQISQLPTSL